LQGRVTTYLEKLENLGNIYGRSPGELQGRVTTYLEKLENLGKWSGKVRKWKKSGEVKSGGCVFSSSKYSKTRFLAGAGSAPVPTGGAYNAPPDSLVGWGGAPQLLQPQLLNN